LIASQFENMTNGGNDNSHVVIITITRDFTCHIMTTWLGLGINNKMVKSWIGFGVVYVNKKVKF
jgi:hypothetical protein